MRILIPDLGYPNADLETEVAGADFTVDAYRWQPGIEARITDESWRSCHALVLYEKIPVTPAIMAKLDNIKQVVRAGVGFDNVDLKGFGAMGIPVCNVPDYGTMDVAEHAIGLLLGLTRGIVEHNERLRGDPIGEWMFHTPPIKEGVNILLGEPNTSPDAVIWELREFPDSAVDAVVDGLFCVPEETTRLPDSDKPPPRRILPCHR